jgi:hypothetical protein
MRSKLAELARRELLESDSKLSPEERLEAYVQQCRLMVELYDAGKRLRDLDNPKDRPE